jgi:hypothetical protein
VNRKHNLIKITLLLLLIILLGIVMTGCDSEDDNFQTDPERPSPSCTNTAYTVSLGGSEYSGLKVQSVSLNPSSPEPGQTVQAQITWKFSGGSNVVNANVYGNWNTSSEIGRIYSSIDGSQTVTKTVSFTAPSTAGNYSLRFIWAYDIGAYASYDLSNLPSSSQCSAWGNSLSVTYNHSFEVVSGSSSCTNTAYTVSLGGSEYSGLKVQSVSLNPSSPEPGQTVQAQITWKFSGGTNVVNANVFGNWNTSSEIGRIYSSIDGSQTVTKTVSFTAPSTAGNYSLRFIWAYDIGAYASYDLSNLPSSSQCSAWGNSLSVTYNHSLQVE